MDYLEIAALSMHLHHFGLLYALFAYLCHINIWDTLRNGWSCLLCFGVPFNFAWSLSCHWWSHMPLPRNSVSDWTKRWWFESSWFTGFHNIGILGNHEDIMGFLATMRTLWDSWLPWGQVGIHLLHNLLLSDVPFGKWGKSVHLKIQTYLANAFSKYSPRWQLHALYMAKLATNS